jgi:plasmid stabilization system protein ParE
MQLNFLQLQELDRLRTLPEFQLLLQMLEADIEDLADEIEAAASDEAERRAVATWRALRICLRRLRGVPDSISPEAQDLREQVGGIPVTTPTTPQEVQFLRSIFHQHAGYPEPDDSESSESM